MGLCQGSTSKDHVANAILVIYLSVLCTAQELFLDGKWPEGTFGLIMAKTGCPDGYFWMNGTRSQLLRFFGEAVFCHSDCNFFGSETWSYPVVDTHYCVKLHPETLNPWPSGSYCVNKHQECPPGFSEGNITWDDHDIGSDENTVSGVLPSGVFDINTVFDYCCRNDGNASVPVELPTSKPFYLYRYKGVCQKVMGMTEKPEIVEFMTQKTSWFKVNIDGAGGSHPDCSVNHIVLHLCYYENFQ